MRSPEEDLELDALQAAMLDALSQHADPAEVLRVLRADPKLAAHRNYIDAMEPRMIEVAAALVAKWGRRDDAAGKSI